MRTNYILIDYENVQPTDIQLLDQEHVRVMVFLGANQSKVPFEFAAALQRMGERAEYIKGASAGSNALDFHITFYLGRLITQVPDAFFHIISNDSGYDPLIEHLRAKKLHVSRSRTINDLPFLRVAAASSLHDRIALIKNDLARRGTSQPRTVQTLSTTINALFQKGLSEDEIAQMIRELKKQKVITVTEKKVVYQTAAV